MRARWLTVALVPLGTLAGHVLGYLAAGQDAGLTGTHDHLRPALWLAMAATTAALAAVALAVRDIGRRGLRGSALLVGQLALFGILEAAEHLRAGHDVHSLVADPSFRWGVGAQLVSAGLLLLATRLARASGQLVRSRLSRRPVLPRPARAQRWCYLDRSLPMPGTVSSVSERGPPWSPAAA